MSPFDADLVLIDGSIALTPALDTPATSTTRDATTGAVVLDLGDKVFAKGGFPAAVRHLVATIILTGAPTDYADTLTSIIQQSDHETFGYENVVTFPTIYAFTRVLSILVTTAFASGDIGATLTGGTTGDTGVIRWFHPDLLTVGKTANLILSMDAAGDLFDDDDEVVTSGVTGAGTMNGVAIAQEIPTLGGPKDYHRAFSITKRYVRANLTVTTGGSFPAQVMLSPYPFQKL